MTDNGSDTPAEGGIGVTIKYGKGYEHPWITFRGTEEEIRSNLSLIFDLAEDGLSVAELVHNASLHAQRLANLGERLGATAISSSESEAQAVATGNTADAWANVGQQAAQPQEEVDPKQVHLDTIAAINDVQALKLYWSENQAAFAEHPELTVAYKARGKALSK